MSSAGKHDVRMRGFVERIQIEEALAVLRPLVVPGEVESIPLDQALGRTLAQDAVSTVHVPGFAKSAVDGYGLRGRESFGASEQSPLSMSLVGEVLPGVPMDRVIAAGEAVRIMTGGPIPNGVDAVVMAEHSEERGDRVFITEPLPPGKNVVAVGEDVKAGDRVLTTGRTLRPQDLGVLASIGVVSPLVYRKPRVAIVTTGNELIPPEEMATAAPGAVVNSNGNLLAGLVEELGCEAIRMGIVADDLASLHSLLKTFEGDLLVTTGGTSVGQEDYLPVVLGEEGELLVHGVSMRPGSPVGFGRVADRLVFLLPGNPVAAAVGFDVLVRPALQLMLGLGEERRNPRVSGRLERKIASALNRIDFVRVRVCDGLVEPVRAGGSGVLTSMTEADGFLMVGKDLEGLDAGSAVEVYLW